MYASGYLDRLSFNARYTLITKEIISTIIEIASSVAKAMIAPLLSSELLSSELPSLLSSIKTIIYNMSPSKPITSYIRT